MHPNRAAHLHGYKEDAEDKSIQYCWRRVCVVPDQVEKKLLIAVRSRAGLVESQGPTQAIVA